MKKLIIPFAAAFGLSLGIATGVVVMRAPKAVAPVKVAKIPSTPRSDSVGRLKDTSTVASDPAKAVTLDSSTKSGAIASKTPSVAASDKSVASATVGGAAANSADARKSAPVPTAANAGKISPTASVAAKPATSVVKPASDSLVERRLAQVFAAMQAKDAARVLEQMDDSDVRAILASLSSKQQAAILGSFPTARAATILQATLRTSGGAE